MAIWVVKFPREGYKIRLIFGQKSAYIKRFLFVKKGQYLTFKVNFLFQKIYESL